MSLRPDPWLGEQLGKPAWHLTPTAEPGRHVAVPGDGPCFVDARLPVSRTEVAAQLEDAGFRLVDTNVQLERKVWPAAIGRRSRFAGPEDRAVVERIAERSFTFSRFHLDPLIDDQDADRIKRSWAGNFFSGERGDGMIVAQHDGEIGGFLQFLLTGDALTIDLVAVDSRLRGKGLARDMIAHAESAVPGVEQLRVGTQLANVPSLRFYFGDGFQLATSSYVFHYHG